jgi:hypothetical protein
MIERDALVVALSIATRDRERADAAITYLSEKLAALAPVPELEPDQKVKQAALVLALREADAEARAKANADAPPQAVIDLVRASRDQRAGGGVRTTELAQCEPGCGRWFGPGAGISAHRRRCPEVERMAIASVVAEAKAKPDTSDDFAARRAANASERAERTWRERHPEVSA